MSRPPFAYYGGKFGLSASLVELMPPHRVYVEPFFGSGAVFFAKPPAAHEIINDIDERVVTFFRVLRDNLDELERVCTLTPHSRSEYLAARAADVGLDDIEVARRFWVSVNQSFAKTANAETGWSVTVARNSSVASSIISRLGRFGPAADRLRRVAIENTDAVDLIERLAKSDDTVIYADPPYLHSTRVGRQNRARDYSHEWATVEDHERLAAALHDTAATVILSGYPSELYDSLYDGWWHQDFDVTAFSSNARTSKRTGRVERVWMNRAPEVTLLSMARLGVSG